MPINNHYNYQITYLKKNYYYVNCYVHNIFTILTQQILCAIQSKK